jgi:hypothetical protein
MRIKLSGCFSFLLPLSELFFPCFGIESLATVMKCSHIMRGSALRKSIIGYEVLIAVTIKSRVFWIVMPYDSDSPVSELHDITIQKTLLFKLNITLD